MLKRVLSFIAIAAVTAFAFCACEPDEPVDNTVALEGITVSPDSLALEVGQTGTLAVAYVPTDASVKPEIIWATSNPAVATVEDGTVTAVGEGKAEIIAKADKFTAKSVVTVTKPETPGPGPEDTWDYTPGEAYAADANLWKAVDAAHTIEWFYNPAWQGEKDAPEMTFKESTYKVTIPDECPNEWNAQAWIRPTSELKLNMEKIYTFSCKVQASTDGNFFMKLYQKGVDGVFCFEIKPRVALKADEILEVSIDSVKAIDAPVDLLIDFSGHAANTTFYIKDITLVEAGDAPVTPDPEPVDTWDYTPSEAFLAETNLWKPVFDANAEGFTTQSEQEMDLSAVPGLEKKESTYKFKFATSTEKNPETGEAWDNMWSNFFFIYPKADHKVVLAADKKYELRYTLGANKDMPHAFVKLTAEGAAPKHEGAWTGIEVDKALTANTPVDVVLPIEGKGAFDNICFTLAFGCNPADVTVYIKDLTIVEIVPETLKFELREGENANMTAAADAAGAAIWHIDADKGVDFDAVVKLNGVATTTGVTVEKYDNGGGHVAINYAALAEARATEIWTVDVTTTNDKVENKEIALRLIHGTYAYSNLEELNADILAAGDSKTVLRILTLSEDAKLYVTKKDKVGDDDYIFAQSKHSFYTGGVLLYKTGSGLGECNTIFGTLVLATTVVKGAPVVVKYTYDQGAITTGYDSNIWPCEEVTIETLKANYNKYINAKVKILNSTITKGFKGSASSGERSGELKDATGTIAIYTYLQEKLVGGEAGWNLNQLTCWPFLYNTNKQVLVWSDGGLNVKNATTTISVAESKTLSLDGEPVALVATSNSPKKGFVFSSSDSNVVEVDPATGVLTPKAAGNATITVSLADTTVVTARADLYKANDDRSVKYLAATAECAVTVQADAIVVPDPVEFDLFANAATVTGSGAEQTATWTSGDITVTAVRATSGTNFRSSDSDHVRFYQNYVVTVTSAAHTIASVEFTCTSNDYATALASNAFSHGTATANASKVTVSNVSASSTSATMGAQSRANHIKVTYEK